MVHTTSLHSHCPPSEIIRKTCDLRLIKINNFCESALNDGLCLAVNSRLDFVYEMCFHYNWYGFYTDILLVSLDKIHPKYISGGAQTFRDIMAWSPFLEIDISLWISVAFSIIHPCNNFGLWTVNRKWGKWLTLHSDYVKMCNGSHIKIKILAGLHLGANFWYPLIYI